MTDKEKCNYIYLLYEREFKNANQPIYKIGKTTQENCRRFSQYPKGSKLILLLECEDCHTMEKDIINDFNLYFTSHEEIGREYFEGDVGEMKTMICNRICRKNTQILLENNNETIKYKYYCEKCEYGTNTIFNFHQHEETKKHKEIDIIMNKSHDFLCNLCSKKYRTYNSLYCHKTRTHNVGTIKEQLQKLHNTS